jgi:hypothetical protein
MYLGGAGGRRVAGEASVEALTEGTKIACASIELLVNVSYGACDRFGMLTYGRASRASASRLSCSLMNLLHRDQLLLQRQMSCLPTPLLSESSRMLATCYSCVALRTQL